MIAYSRMNSLENSDRVVIICSEPEFLVSLSKIFLCRMKRYPMEQEISRISKFLEKQKEGLGGCHQMFYIYFSNLFSVPFNSVLEVPEILALMVMPRVLLYSLNNIS